MTEIMKYKNELREIIEYALKEYGNSTLAKRELIENGFISEGFGSLIADITMVTAEKNRLYLRRYDVKTAKGDKVVSFILGHAAMLFAISARKFREELLSTEHIKGVATLKQSVFDHIVMPAAIIILGEGESETWLAAAENMDQLVDMFCGNFDGEWTVYYAEHVSSENLLPEYYNGDDKIIEEQLSGSDVKELQEVATIIPGKRAPREQFLQEGIPFLRARDIKDGKITMPDMYVSPDRAELYSRQLLQEGDILLTKNFGQNKLALVTEDDIPAIASDMLYIIRPFEVSEGYLYRYLTSKTGNEIFNKQVNRIQKGVSVPSVALSDLIHVEVPVLDEETMQSLESIDTISNNEIVEAAKGLIQKAWTNSESIVEQTVRHALLDAGWDEKSFIPEKEATVIIGRDRIWRPDIAYILPDGRKIIIEIKADFARLTAEWIERMQHILKGEDIFILTTGMYYETHIPGIKKSLQMISPPTIEQILNWEKEVR